MGLALTSCTVPVADEEAVGRQLQPIVNGVTDSTYQAVVAWIHGSKCSATIVATNPSTGEGWALTAAHCVNQTLGNLRQGNNHANGQFDRQYPVADVDVHPGYGDASAFDFAMIRFTGADANTPVLPVLAPSQDTLTAGSSAVLVGYGNVNGPSGTTLRHRADVTVDGASPTLVAWDQQNGNGGVCSGDSGGPALYDVGGSPQVAAVHSFITDSTCEDFGVSVRASAVKESFVDPFIAGQPYGLETCSVCRDAHASLDGRCTGDIQACQNSATCQAFLNCAQGCATNACVVQCSIDQPAGRAAYDSIIDCYCTEACPAECAGDSLCLEPGACWLPSTDPNPSCQSCLDTACCAEATECATDAECNTCLTSTAKPLLCNTKPKVQAVLDCVEACDPSCDFGIADASSTSSSSSSTTGVGGGEPGVGGADPTTTVTSGGLGAGGAAPVAAPAGTVTDSGCQLGRGSRGGEGAAWLLAALVGCFTRRRRAR